MNGYVLLGLMAVLACVLVTDVEAGCGGTAKKCCTGKDNSCRARGPRMNGKSTKTCYCDENCLVLKDCCTDYQETCPAVDCVAGDWEPYGDCSASCGTGVKTRKRPIIQKAMNGGKGCGTIEEKVYCQGERCKVARHSTGHLEVREIGKIIPAEYGYWRSSKLYNPYKDIRRNLFNHYNAKDKIRRPTYSATFEITKMKSACQEAFGGALRIGSTVCVECEPFAMKRSVGVRCEGHGVYMRESRWNAVMVSGCQGKWVMKSRHEQRECPQEATNSFILL